VVLVFSQSVSASNTTNVARNACTTAKYKPGALAMGSKSDCECPQSTDY